MFEIFISHQAEKQYKKLDKKTKQRVNISINNLSQYPFSGKHIKKLRGALEGKHRYAIGDIRIVYEIDTDVKAVKVLSIKSRGDVYKK